MEESINEISLVERTVDPHESTSTIFLSLKELTLICLRSIIPDLLTEAVLLVVSPLALVLATIQVLEGALPIGLTIAEASLVVLSVGEYLPPVAMRLISMEGPLIFGPVLPEHDTDAILDVTRCG